MSGQRSESSLFALSVSEMGPSTAAKPNLAKIPRKEQRRCHKVHTYMTYVMVQFCFWISKMPLILMSDDKKCQKMVLQKVMPSVLLCFFLSLHNQKLTFVHNWRGEEDATTPGSLSWLSMPGRAPAPTDRPSPGAGRGRAVPARPRCLVSAPVGTCAGGRAARRGDCDGRRGDCDGERHGGASPTADRSYLRGRSARPEMTFIVCNSTYK